MPQPILDAYKKTRRTLSVLLTITLTLTAWSVFQGIRSPIVGRCSYGREEACQRVEVQHGDPYCRVDPLCMDSSRPATTESTMIGSNQGLAVLPADSALVYDSPLDWLATANLEAFRLAIAGVLLAVCIIPIPRYTRRAALLAIVTWCSAEVWRWQHGISQVFSQYGPTLLPAAYLTPMILSVLVMITFGRLSKWRLAPAVSQGGDSTH